MVLLHKLHCLDLIFSELLLRPIVVVHMLSFVRSGWSSDIVDQLVKILAAKLLWYSCTRVCSGQAFIEILIEGMPEIPILWNTLARESTIPLEE